MFANVNANLKIIRGVIFNNATDIKDQSVEPYEYDELLQRLHDEAEAAYQEYGEAQKQVEIIQKQLEAVQKNARGTSSMRAK
ncbi:hypothetical protein PC110_g20488 [Phytophthora cactorum]|uniref:Uncharacterized protein n=1 Tax=Phytophthora cactorum TaxID=29920 RepID=A0A329REF8_9STRA|nr:hypothetical protein PC110_g20488 [Phytophthora cactorum]